MSTTLFEQASGQLNFLLLAQRNMILISAFSLALATFKTDFNYPLMKYFVVILFAYAIAVGAKSIVDFNAYIKDAREDEPALAENEINLLNRYEEWVYFTYALLVIIVIILLTFAQVEFFNNFHYFFGIKKNKKLN